MNSGDESVSMALIRKSKNFNPKNPEVKTISREKIALVAAILDFNEDF